MKKISTLAVLAISFAVPLLAAAQTGYSSVNLGVITPYSTGIINLINGILVPVLMAVAFIVFLWGVYKYFILGAADEEARKQGRQFTLWGIIGFVVILSLWGIINLIMGTFGLSAGTAPPYPTLGGSQSQQSQSSAFPGAGTIGGGSGGITSAQQQQALLTAQAAQAAQIMDYNCQQYGQTSAQCQAAISQVMAVYQANCVAGGGTFISSSNSCVGGTNGNSAAEAVAANCQQNTSSAECTASIRQAMQEYQASCTGGGGTFNSTDNSCTGGTYGNSSGGTNTYPDCPNGYDFNGNCAQDTTYEPPTYEQPTYEPPPPATCYGEDEDGNPVSYPC